ncbi:PDZ domain-containing protein [Varibaculum cambriense]|uniref:YlbL family protein n=1 Tax=Varibaculum cambriense TaxID=184870 RepID=UPI0029052213|nr:S16 family serine protease [Varibaculum cambriense]MDU1224053.1 S16 family serine protease [Varibaculum cambriense]
MTGKRSEKSRRQGRIGKIMMTLSVIGFLILGFAVRAPYVIESPGPTFNVLGSQSGHGEIIKVTGAKTYPTTGQLRMVTVSLRGGPGTHVTYAEVLLAKMRSDSEVLPESAVYPAGATAKQVQQVSQAQMEDSQLSAKVAALSELGYQVPAKFKVTGVGEDSDFRGKLKENDILQEVTFQGKTQELNQANTLFDILEGASPGTSLQFKVQRSGKNLLISGKTRQPTDGRRGSQLGIYLDPQAKLPVDIKIALQEVGGPSAGTMFALGIIDRMTAKSLTGGKEISGTGAISYGGQVLAISGIPQKMAGAKEDGAHWFLLPRSNCAQVKPMEGIRAVPVQDLQQARQVSAQIAANNLKNLPRCPAH